jgi:prolipoprotein diacylglyceryltransferase
LYKKYAGPLEKLKNPEVYNKYKNDPYQLAIKERIPRYPAQLFEAICYVFIFIVLMGMYLIPAIRFREGFIFGVFLILLFSARYYVENVKSSQGGFESVIGLDITTGQWLSIPFILAGFYYLVSSKKKHEA